MHASDPGTDGTDPDATPRPGADRELLPWLVVFGVLAVALNQRTALASIPPVLSVLRHDLSLGRAAAGLLTAIPVACMGIFAPAAVLLGRRYGVERAILGAVALLGVALIARGLFPGPLPVYGATLAIGIGMAVAGTLLNAFVKARFPVNAALVTGLYSASLGLGAAAAASGTAPLASALGGSWRAAIALWGIPSLIACFLWFPSVGVQPASRTATPSARRPALPWGDRRAWLATAIFSLQSFLYYAILTWLAPLYQERGWSPNLSGLLLSTFTLLQLAGSLTIPALANHARDRRPWVMGAAAITTIGLIGVTSSPLSLPWVWAAVMGFGVGGMFPLALTLPLDYADTPLQAGAFTAMALLVGYIIAAFAPFLIGALRDLSGSYTPAFLAVCCVSVALLATTSLIRPHRA